MLLLAAAVFLAVVAGAAWRYEPHEAAVLGMVVAFAAVVLTCYYWVMLLLVPLGRGRWLPTAAWLGLNSLIYALHLATRTHLSFELVYGLISWALALYFLVWMGPDAVKNIREGWTRLRRTKSEG